MKKFISTLAAVALAGAPMLALAQTVDVNAGTNVRTDTVRVDTRADVEVKREEAAARQQERLEARITDARERANREIDRRVAGLEKFSDRIAAMRRLSADVQTSLRVDLANEEANLQTLRARIIASSDAETLREYLASIRQSHRIFGLIMPKAAVSAAADRVLSIATQLEQFSAKLAERIAGNTDATLAVSLAEAHAKIADAKAKANAAVDKMSNFSGDVSDQAVFDAHKTTIREAHAMVKEAQQLLKEAHRIMADIAKKLRTANASVETNTEASAETE